MKRRLMIVLLCICVVISGCSWTKSSEKVEGTEQEELTESTNNTDSVVDDENKQEQEEIPVFNNLSDRELCPYLEETIFTQVVSNLSSEEYFVEGVNAVYMSKEYIEELAYNSQANVYFGYTLTEIEKVFGEEKYVFTCDDNGQTVVKKYDLYDDTFDQIVKNVAIGTGVILLCVTVSLVAAPLGAPAVSAIFAVSAKTGTVLALESAGISAAITALVTGIETRDVETTLKQTALAASDGFKFGAIMGSVTGGVGELITLGQATKGGLTMNEAAIIQKETGQSSKFIKEISSMKEYEELVKIAEQGGLSINEMAEICNATKYPLSAVKMFRTTKEGMIYSEEAGLFAKIVNGKVALVRNIDLTYKSELAGKAVTNLERMRLGYAPIDPLTGKTYQLHHIGQKIGSPLAILTTEEHMSSKNNGILHDLNIADGKGVHSLISESEWAAQRKEFWKGLYEILK